MVMEKTEKNKLNSALYNHISPQSLYVDATEINQNIVVFS